MFSLVIDRFRRLAGELDDVFANVLPYSNLPVKIKKLGVRRTSAERDLVEYYGVVVHDYFTL